MARIEQRGTGSRHKPKPVVFKQKKPKKAKGHKGRHHKGHTTHTAHTGHGSHSFHEAAGAGSVGNAHSGSLPLAGVGSSAGASPRTVVALSGLNTASAEGLGGAILDLVGEGHLTVAHALAAWTHEQDRLANRAWRRPGGQQRMGGL